ncbi:MAG TPA: hypothetical protein VGR87_02495 [Candidatus Limnocylindria bacterium]|jgi:hypothetical protein|nr:hypothetical protein [Candidatus Limnocylindria bacterium]
MHPVRIIRLVGVGVLAFSLGIAGTVLAGHLADASYTGCLSSAAGLIYNVKAGDDPLRPCRAGDVVVHVSGGDVTAVNAGAGLVGGGTSGDLSLAIDYATLDTRYLGVTSQAADSARLGGLPPTAFAFAGHNHDDRYYTELESDARYARSGQACFPGQFVTTIDSGGAIQCAGAAGGPRARALVFTPPGGGPLLSSSLNFQSVTMPIPGFFCLRPAPGVIASGSTPVVSVDLDLSSGTGLMAFAYTKAHRQQCTPDDYEVMTVRAVGGTPELWANVAFTIVVP